MKLQLPILIAASSAASVRSQGEIYLTFDDGPIDATFGVLDVLRETDTKATFFINGFHLFGEGDENEDDALAALKQLVDDGHVLANHSWNHMLHYCCNDEGECGSVICNEIGMWNVKAYQDIQNDKEYFHLNTQVVRQLLKSHNSGQILSTDKLHSMARLPYTNSYRLDDMNSDCSCCTSDDVPPWDPEFTCTLEKPSFSATLSALVADELKSDGMEVFGWDLEWGPDDWGADDPAASLTTAQDLAERVVSLSETETCSAHAEIANVAHCNSNAHHGKVVILTHDFLFEDGKRGQGATTNLPKLLEFIVLMRQKGYVFKTMDQYHESIASNEDQEKDSIFRGGKAGKGRKRL